jgi:tRNA(fMet)-specific endonuclease VapC
MIADTTFIIDLLRNDAAANERASDIESAHSSLYITAVSIFELWQGFRQSNSKKELLTLVSRMPFLNLGFEAAAEAGKIHSDLREKGQEIETPDSLLAGIAKSRNEPLLTRNVKHFSRIKGLMTESY